MNSTLNRETAPARAASQETTTACVSSTTPILPAKPARVKRLANSPDPRIAAAVILLVDWDNKIYSVESDSRPGTFHQVQRTFGERTCSCAATRTCWHISAVMPRYRADLRRQTAMTNAWLADMTRPGLVPTPVVMAAEEPECCDAEEVPRVVEVHTGWEYRPAPSDLMNAYGW